MALHNAPIPARQLSLDIFPLRMVGWTSLANAVVGAGLSMVNCHPVKSEMPVVAPKSQPKEPIQLDIILVCRKQTADCSGLGVGPDSD